MASNTPFVLSERSQKSFIAFYETIQESCNELRSSRRAYFEEVDKQYQREKNETEENRLAKIANKYGDSTRAQDITVPVVMPQVEAAVTYQTSVFLTGYPIFGVVSPPEYMDEAIQLESKIEEDSEKGGWPRQFILFFRDSFKYNFAPIEVSWKEEKTTVVETDTSINLKEGVAKETIWSGNCIKRLDPYNTFVDHRVPPSQVHIDGEYAGYTEFMSRIKFKAFLASLPDKIIANVEKALKSNTGTVGSAIDSGSRDFYEPTVNSSLGKEHKIQTGTNWMNWAQLSNTRKENLEYKDGYQITTLYARILPSEFSLKVPNSNTPQIWKLIIVNHQIIIYAELQTNAHNFLPLLVGQPHEDGLNYQTKSLADNGKEFQEVTSAYMTSIVASRRRAISDRIFYDPSRVSSAHMNNPNPAARTPVKPGAYGKPVSEALHALPYREDQAGQSMQQIKELLQMSNDLVGQNRVSHGQFQKGNKTRREFEAVMGNATGRDQLASILLEHQVFSPIKFILKLNILQYEGGTEVYNRDKNKVVEIDPVKLRKAVLAFKVSDGIMPSDKLINGDSFATSLQVLGSSPNIAAEYNVGRVFSYLMKTQGADLTAFEKSQEQLAYEQALASWQNTVAQIVQANPEAQIPPQPLPEQFGYDPKNNKPSPPETDKE